MTNVRKLRLSLAALVVCFSSSGALSQSSPLQGGSWTLGHAPMYGGGTAQPIIIDSGPARGGNNGVGLGELNITARGTGTPPYDAQGTGPNGEIFCLNDAPINNATGYHYLCFSPDVGGAGLITYGAGGVAAQQPLKFNINGQTVTGATCSGTPSSSFATVNGIVTHC